MSSSFLSILFRGLEVYTSTYTYSFVPCASVAWRDLAFLDDLAPQKRTSRVNAGVHGVCYLVYFAVYDLEWTVDVIQHWCPAIAYLVIEVDIWPFDAVDFRLMLFRVVRSWQTENRGRCIGGRYYAPDGAYIYIGNIPVTIMDGIGL